MTDPIDKQAAEFNRLRAKRLASQGPTNSAATTKPGANASNFHARRAAHRVAVSTRQLEASKARVAEAQAALEARREVAAKQAAAREAKAKLAATQAALAESARQESAAASAPARPATMTAAEYLASIAKPTMTRLEFEKIPHGQRGEVIKRVKLVP